MHEEAALTRDLIIHGTVDWAGPRFEGDGAGRKMLVSLRSWKEEGGALRGSSLLVQDKNPPPDQDERMHRILAAGRKVCLRVRLLLSGLVAGQEAEWIDYLGMASSRPVHLRDPASHAPDGAEELSPRNVGSKPLAQRPVAKVSPVALALPADPLPAVEPGTDGAAAAVPAQTWLERALASQRAYDLERERSLPSKARRARLAGVARRLKAAQETSELIGGMSAEASEKLAECENAREADRAAWGKDREERVMRGTRLEAAAAEAQQSALAAAVKFVELAEAWATAASQRQMEADTWLGEAARIYQAARNASSAARAEKKASQEMRISAQRVMAQVRNDIQGRQPPE